MANDDTRIVQMQFDNRQFERNIARSQSSLEKFKQALNFDEVGRGLSRFGDSLKNMAFDTLSDNIQKITDKFTGLGHVGEFVLSRIRASLEGAIIKAEEFAKSMTFDQMASGQNKYDALTKSVQTIVASGSATEKQAYSIMERVMAYTDQTSASYETMVSQISSLTSIGVPLQKAERYMEGFANASSKAGADAGRSAIAMQTYTKAMGSYLTKQEFDTLNLTAKVVTKEWREEMIAAGVAAGDLEKDSKGVIKTAKKYGKQVKVTADTIESTLSKKWASRKTLSIFAERYGFGETIEELQHPEEAADSFGKTAYLTGQRALTFADALNAVKESISGGWMSTFRILFGDLTDAMNLWTGACNKVIDAISGLAEARNSILRTWREMGGRDDILKIIFGEMEDVDGNVLYEGAYGIIDIFTDIGNMISEAFWHTFMNLIPKDAQKQILDYVNSNLGPLNEGLEAMGLGEFKRTKPFESFQELWNSEFFKQSGGRTGMFGGALQGITSQIQEFVQGINDWFNEVDVDSGMTRLERIQTVLDAIGRTIAFVLEIGGGIVHFFEVLADDKHLGPALKSIENLLVKLGLSITDAENEASNAGSITRFFEDLADILIPVCEIINIVVGAFTELIGAMVDGEGEHKHFTKVFARVGNTIKKVIEFVSKAIRPFAEFVKEISGILGELFKDGFNKDSVDKAKKRFSEALTKLWDGVKLAFKPLTDLVGQLFGITWDELKSRVEGYFKDPDSLGNKILAPLKTILRLLEPFRSLLENVWNTVRGMFTGEKGELKGPTLFDTLKTIFTSSSVSHLFSKLKDMAKDGGLYNLLLAALGGIAIWKIIQMVRKITEFFDEIGSFFTDFFDNLKSAIFGDDEEGGIAEKLHTIAESITMLAACVAVLGSMELKDVAQGVTALIVIMGALFGFVKLMEVMNAATLGKTALVIAAVSALAMAISILVIALLPFAIVSWEGFARMIAGLTLILLDLIGFMKLMSVLSLTGAGLAFTGIIRFALAIGILVYSLVPFMIADWQAMLRGVAGLAIVLVELIGFMRLMQVLSLSTMGLAFTGIARFALAVGILIYSLVPFMIADWSAMLRGVAGLAIVLVELIGFMKLMSVLGLSADGLALASFARFGMAIGILMLSMIPFMIADWPTMLRAVAGLGIVLLELIGFMRLMQTLSLSTMGLKFKGIKTFVISIGILMLSLIPFMIADWSAMLRAVAGLGIVLAELALFMGVLKKMSAWPDVSLGGFIGFAASIAVLVLSLSALANMDWEGWARAMAGLTIVLLAVLGFMAVAQRIAINPASIGMVIAVCLSISVMALLMSAAMNEVRNIKWEVLLAFTGGMALVISALAAAIAGLSVIPVAAGIKGILLITIGIAAFIEILTLLGPALIEAMGTGFAHLSGKLELISGLLTGFANRMAGINESDIDKAGSIFDKLKDILWKLSGWGRFVGDLDNFSYAMFVLGTGMEIFNNHVGKSVGELNSNAQAALKFIQDLSGCANDLDTISKMNMDNLIAAIMGLGGAMSIYAYGAKEIQGLLAPGETPDKETVSQAIGILQAISQGLAEAGGFTIPDNMPDEQSLSLFGASLAALATAMVKFEEAGKGMGDGTEKALSTITFFKNLKDELVRQDFSANMDAAIGVFEKNGVTKDKLTTFAKNIEELGLAMKAFYESTTLLDETSGERKSIDFSGAVGTLDSLVKLQGKLGWDFGPLINFFAGRTKDFTDLSGEIEALGTALQDFIEKLGGVDEAGNPKLDTKLFDDAIDIADKIVDYLNKLKGKTDRVGGIWGGIRGTFIGREFNFTDLKTQIEAIAQGLGSLGELKIEGKLLTIDETTGIFKVLDQIIDYLVKLRDDKRFEQIGGLYNIVNGVWTGRKFDFTDLRGQLEAFGTGVAALAKINEGDNKLITTEETPAIFAVLDEIIAYLDKLRNDKRFEQIGGLYNIVNTVWKGRKFDFRELGGQLESLGKGLTSLTSFAIDPKSGASIFSEGATTLVEEVLDDMIEYMQTLGKKLPTVGGLGNFLNTLWNGRTASFEDLGKELKWLGDGLKSFNDALKTGEIAYDPNMVNEAMRVIESMVNIIRVMNMMGDELTETNVDMSGHVNRIYKTADYVRAMWHMLDYMTEGGTADDGERFGSITQKLAAFLIDFDNSISELGGLKNADAATILTEVTNAIRNIVTAAKSIQNEDGTFVDFSNIGNQICNGIVDGILTGRSRVVNAAIDMAVSAYEAAKGALDIESPSKVFEELGLYVGAGFAKGIDESTPGTDSSAENMAEGAIHSAQDAMSLFASLMSQEIDANPTITPVLDMSNITAGADAINGLLGGTRNLNLAGAGGDYSSASIPKSDEGTSDYRGQDLTWIGGAIQGLGNRIDTMADKISKMQIVMNTGALVGEVTDGINRNLGAKTTYNRRRN